jgi:branched-chain amino acid transport system permease protein
LILGYAGILSLGHAAFLGLGAYTAGLFAKHVSGDPLLGMAVAALVTAVGGFLSSFLVLRGADLTRLMVTLGLAMLLGEVANKANTITGGADGLQGITMGPLLGRFEFDMFGRTAYLYSLATLLLLFLVARRLVASPFGMSVRAIRDNPLRAGAIGIPVNRRLVTVYTIAAVYAGIAGALLAQTTQFVSLDVLEMHRSADVLLVLVIGGTGYLYGGLIGALVFKLLQDALSSLTPQYWHFYIGLLLVILVLVGRDRVSSFFRFGRAKAEGGA